jgi:DNA-binding Lrp family transcriptional regulator
MIPAKKIDEIDAKILKDLLKDGRKEFIEIAREAQVTKDVIWQHYTNLKKRGIIVGATIQLNYAALGFNVAASFFVDVPVHQQQQVIEQLRKIPGLYDAKRWGSNSCLWAVSDFMKADQIGQVKQLIKKLPEVLRLEVEVWTGVKGMPENLSVLTNDEISSDTEKRESQIENRIEKNVGKIDEIDRKIIEKLAVNSRASFNVIGKELGISTSTAVRRYNDLKRNGVIRTLIQINPTRIGYPIMACFRLSADSQGDSNSIAKKIAKIPDVNGILKTTGAYDLTIFTAIKNFEHLFALETEISNIDDVRELDTPALNQFPVLPYPREHISTF